MVNRKMSILDSDKTVYMIVHGQHNLIDTVMHKLISLGFLKDNLIQASVQKTGNVGDYVAMAWPPMHANEIIINEITGTNSADIGEKMMGVMGAWSNIDQKELSRIPLS